MDNWFILFLIVLAYLDINSKIKKILGNQTKDTKRDFSMLENLKGKEVQIEVNNDDIFAFDNSQKGILKDFNNVWFILEKKTKKGKELIYYRIADINGISEVK